MLGNAPLSAVPLSSFPAALPTTTTKIAGYTRNRCGVITTGATVILFRSSDNIPVATTTSDGTGYYEFVDPVGAPFFAASFSADGTLAGVTARNLIPA